MSVAAELHDVVAIDTSLVLIDRPKCTDAADQLGQLVVQLVALAGAPVDPTHITPAALVLRGEDLIDLPHVTFGCNYELDVRSIELDRGYVRAVDSGWLTLRSGEVQVDPEVAPPYVNSDASTRAREVFALERQELIRAARHHLFREADDRTGRSA